jgi:ADP-ribosyl-[dinitrogen reductase] hydrolase
MTGGAEHHGDMAASTKSIIIPGSEEDRAVGALVGLAVGDALGTPVEFKHRGSFEPVTFMRGGGVFELQPGEWTDDTSMALALSEALLQDPDLTDPGAVMDRWVDWYRNGAYSHGGECFDIGTQTSASLTDWSRTRELPSRDTESAGNGCIMRLAPVVLAQLHRPAHMRDLARRQSDFTHRNAACRDISVKLAELIAACIQGDVDAIAAQIPPDIAARTEGQVKSTGYVIDTFEAALWAFAPQDGFPAIVLRAVNLGDDADTVGAVTGQIAGARYGLSQIPPAWLEVLAWRDAIIDLGRKLYRLWV